MLQIVPLEKSRMDSALQFLQSYEEKAQFLINNLKAHGPYLGEHHNSGNFKLILRENKIVGLYCLTRRGNLPTLLSPTQTT